MLSNHMTTKAVYLLFCAWFCLGCFQVRTAVVCRVGRLQVTPDDSSNVQVVTTEQNETEEVLWNLDRPKIGYLYGSEFLISGTLQQIIGEFREKPAQTDEKQKDAITIAMMSSDSNIGDVLLLETVYYGGCYNLFETRMTMFSKREAYYCMVFDACFGYGIYPVWGVSCDGGIRILERTWNNGNKVYDICCSK